MQRAAVSLRHEVDGRVYVAQALGRPCSNCGADGVDEETRQRFTLLVAARLSEPSGATVKFMRDALRLRAAELAELLDVSIETLSRWENDRITIPRTAHTVLSALVRDALEGRSRTLDILRTLAEPSREKRKVTIELSQVPRRKRSSGVRTA